MRMMLRRFLNSWWPDLFYVMGTVVMVLFVLHLLNQNGDMRASLASSNVAHQKALSELASQMVETRKAERLLEKCRETQRPEARCKAEGGSPATWSDGFTQCFFGDKMAWSSK